MSSRRVRGLAPLSERGLVRRSEDPCSISPGFVALGPAARFQSLWVAQAGAALGLVVLGRGWSAASRRLRVARVAGPLVARSAAGREQFRHLHLGDRALVVSC